MKLEAVDVRPLKAAIGQASSIPAAAAEVAQLFDGWSVPGRQAFVVINPIGAVICQAELPRMPLSEARAALRLKHRDFKNYYLDLTERGASDNQLQKTQSTKMELLVGAAPREDVLWYRNVLLTGKVRPVTIELSAHTIVNGLLTTDPELCRNEAVLLLDLGTHTTSMNFLWHNRLLFTHVMQFGSQQITEYLAEKFRLELPVAETAGQMTDPAQSLMAASISPLARELRWSIDFFDRQHACRVSRAFACGSIVWSAKTLANLGHEAGIQIEAWNCLQRLDTTQTRGDHAQLAAIAPELAAAVGAALARL